LQSEKKIQAELKLPQIPVKEVENGSIFQTLITSPALTSTVGAVLAYYPVAKFATGVSVIGGIITTRNELKNATSSVKDISIQTPLEKRSGIIGFIKEVSEAPAFALSIQFIAGLFSSVSALKQRKYSLGAALINYTLGGLGAIALANKEYRPPPRERLRLEEGISKLWSSVPEEIQEVLKNPALFYAIGHMCLSRSIKSLPSSKPYYLRFKQFGLGAYGASFIFGLVPILTKEKMNESGQYLSSIGNLSISIFSFLQKNPFYGFANLCWSYSNFLYAQRVKETRLQGDNQK
jgi:hypothetical protein